MAINTGGYRLSTLPHANVDFRVAPVDLRGLGAGIKSSLNQIGDQKRLNREKERQGKIRLAAFGDKDAMKSLDEADRGYVEELKLKIDSERKRLELLDAQIEAARAAAGQEGYKRGMETLVPQVEPQFGVNKETGRIDFVPFSIGKTMGEGTEQEKNIAAGAIQEIQKKALDNLAKERGLETAGLRNLTAELDINEKMDAKDLQEAFQLVKSGEAKAEDYKDKDWYYDLTQEIKYEDPAARYKIIEPDGFSVLIDKKTGKEVAIRQKTELENFITSLPEEDRPAVRSQITQAKLPKEKTSDITIGKDKYRLTDTEREIFDNFNLALNGSKKSSWFFGRKINLSDKDKEDAKANFIRYIRTTNPSTFQKDFNLMRNNPAKQYGDVDAEGNPILDAEGNPVTVSAMEMFDRIYGKDSSSYLLNLL